MTTPKTESSVLIQQELYNQPRSSFIVDSARDSDGLYLHQTRSETPVETPCPWIEAEAIAALSCSPVKKRRRSSSLHFMAPSVQSTPLNRMSVFQDDVPMSVRKYVPVQANSTFKAPPLDLLLPAESGILVDQNISHDDLCGSPFQSFSIMGTLGNISDRPFPIINHASSFSSIQCLLSGYSNNLKFDFKPENGPQSLPRSSGRSIFDLLRSSDEKSRLILNSDFTNIQFELDSVSADPGSESGNGNLSNIQSRIIQSKDGWNESSQENDLNVSILRDRMNIENKINNDNNNNVTQNDVSKSNTQQDNILLQKCCTLVDRKRSIEALNPAVKPELKRRSQRLN